MSFHSTASDIEIVDGHVLKADLTNADGEEQEATIDLDEIIGNNNGKLDLLGLVSDFQLSNMAAGEFYWEGENFSHCASDMELDFDNDDGLPILRAKLNNVDGEEIDNVINLAERIGNNDGFFQFV